MPDRPRSRLTSRLDDQQPGVTLFSLLQYGSYHFLTSPSSNTQLRLDEDSGVLVACLSESLSKQWEPEME